MRSYDTWGAYRETEKKKGSRGERNRSYDPRVARSENVGSREKRGRDGTHERINGKIRFGGRHEERLRKKGVGKESTGVTAQR